VVRLVFGRGVTLAAIGVALGLLAGLGLARVLRSLIYEVSPADPLTFGAVALLVFSVAALACYLPARRATEADPMSALRAE
jgi:putative ABC transport system permease protein